MGDKVDNILEKMTDELIWYTDENIFSISLRNSFCVYDMSASLSSEL